MRRTPIVGCATKADALAESQTLIGVLETAMSSLKEVGAQGAVVMSRSGGRAAPEKGKGKRTSKGNSKEAHELKSCDTGTLRYRADVPLNARRGAQVDRSPQGLQDTISWAHTTGPQRVYEPHHRWTGHSSGTGTDTDLSESRGCSDVYDSD